MDVTMSEQVDPANVRPGQHPPVPTTREELLIEALRSANRVSVLLNEIAAWSHRQEAEFPDLEDLLIRRFSDCSGVHLFIAANNLGIDLPPDLQDEVYEEGDGD
jgi:hypothetical protein